MYFYRQYQQPSPGCSPGCLIFLLILFLMGGTKLLALFFGLIWIVGPVLLLLIPLFLSGIRQSRIRTFIKTHSEDQKQFIELLVRLLAYLVKIDGAVHPKEVSAVRHYFQYSLKLPAQELLWTRDLLKKALKAQDRLEDLCAQFNESFGYEPKLVLCDQLYRVAMADGSITPGERACIDQIVRLLGISAAHEQSIRGQFFSEGQEERYYSILGLTPGAGFEAIRSNWRKLSVEFHPDKVTHLGPEFVKAAEEKMKQINEAYEYFKRKFSGN